MSPRFKLWNLVFSSDNASCSLDVTPEDVQLARGTIDLIMAFLKEFAIEAVPRDWTITPFISAYYSSAPHMPDFRDRHSLAWRCRIMFAAPITHDVNHSLAPRSVDMVDVTSKFNPDAWLWTEGQYVVIADVHAAMRSDTVVKLSTELARHSIHPVEHLNLTTDIVQLRSHLGVVRFPEDEPDVVQLLRFCEKQGASVNWASTLSGTFKKLWQT